MYPFTYYDQNISKKKMSKKHIKQYKEANQTVQRNKKYFAISL